MSYQVRISEDASRTLRELSTALGEPMSKVLDRAVEALRRQQFLMATNEAYARLRADEVGWKGVLEERAEWEGTLKDGIEE